MDRTFITDNNRSFLESGPKTPAELIQFMRNGAVYRTFGDRLKEIWPKDLGQNEFLQQYMEISGENLQQATDNLDNWLTGAHSPQSREKVFQICFALHLNEDDTNRLLGSYDDGMHIHYRNPEELVYAYALRAGLNYKEAQELKERVRVQYMTEEWTAASATNVSKETRYVKKDFGRIETESELMTFFDNHIHELGVMHATAYQSFKEMLERLKNPEPEAFLKELQEAYNRELEQYDLNQEQLEVGAQQFVLKEKKYSNDRIAREYFRSHIPNGQRTPLQAMIVRYWPNAAQLGAMAKGRLDVSRKMIILLHLILDVVQEPEQPKNLSETHYGADFVEEKTASEILDEQIGDIEEQLVKYGMNRLDAGNAFDYIVMYSLMATYDDDEYYGDRLDAVLDELFNNEHDE